MAVILVLAGMLPGLILAWIDTNVFAWVRADTKSLAVSSIVAVIALSAAGVRLVKRKTSSRRRVTDINRMLAVVLVEALVLVGFMPGLIYHLVKTEASNTSAVLAVTGVIAFVVVALSAAVGVYRS